MLNFLKGKRTYLTIIVGLIIAPATTALMGFDLGQYVEALVSKTCEPDSQCLTIAKELGASAQNIYLIGVGALIAYFKNLGVKQAKADAQL